MAGGVWDGTIAAIVGAISGGLVSWAIASGSSRTERRARYYERFEQSLDELQFLAVDYWRRAGRDEPTERKLISLMEGIDVRLDALLRRVSKHGVATSATSLFDHLTDDVTGGSFETAARRRDVLRVSNIKQRCREMKDLLHSV